MESGKAAKRLIKRFGTEVILKREVKGEYNPSEGEYTIDLVSENKGLIVILSNTLNKSSKFHMDLDVNEDEGEKKAIIDISSIILINDIISHNNKLYKIIKHREVEQKGEILFHKVVIRERNE